MDVQVLKERIPTSPAFIIDESEVLRALHTLAELKLESGCKLLYSIKTLSLSAILALVKPYVDGFSVSSLFEARLANELLMGAGGIHLTSPGLKTEEITELVGLCSHISANSLGQYQRFFNTRSNLTSIGLRVNPKLSFSSDDRYDPCRTYSKLGMDLAELEDFECLQSIQGLHFHTVYSAKDYQPLLQTVAKLRAKLGKNLGKLSWLNLGGGYLFDEIPDKQAFVSLVQQLKHDYELDVIIEPGNAVVGKAGYLLATVVDSFKSDGKTVGVLDTSVNHQPQVFEYQRQPELLEHDVNGSFPTLIAGSTCLAGDLFGDYVFNKPLSVGDKLVFKNLGAYSLVKANRFNGYNLPDVYFVNHNHVSLIKHHTYQDYKQLWADEC